MGEFKDIRQLIFRKEFIISYPIAIVFLFTIRYSNLTWIYEEVVVLLLFCFSLYLIRIDKMKSIGFGILCAVASIIVLNKIYPIYKSFFSIKEWDFLAFYLYGKLGAAGVDFYDPANIAKIFSTMKLPFEVSESFFKGVIQVGFIYPPVSMLIFAPIGYLNIETANISWKIFELSFLIMDIILLVKIFSVVGSQWINILVIFIITLVFPGTTTTILFNQTNFVLLFFMLLIYKDPENWKSGVYLILAVLIKPVAAVWFLYYIINKKWAPMAAASLSGVLLILLSVVLFGYDNYISFFSSPPTVRLPETQYMETINQSLFATITRIGLRHDISSLFSHRTLITIILSVLLMVVTCIVSRNLAKSSQRLSFLIFIPFSLLIYPGFLSHYTVLLIPVLIRIVSQKNNLDLLIFAILVGLFFISSFTVVVCLLLMFIVYSYSNFSNILLIRSKSSSNEAKG